MSPSPSSTPWSAARCGAASACHHSGLSLDRAAARLPSPTCAMTPARLRGSSRCGPFSTFRTIRRSCARSSTASACSRARVHAGVSVGFDGQQQRALRESRGTGGDPARGLARPGPWDRPFRKPVIRAASPASGTAATTTVSACAAGGRRIWLYYCGSTTRTARHACIARKARGAARNTPGASGSRSGSAIASCRPTPRGRGDIDDNSRHPYRCAAGTQRRRRPRAH